MHIRRFENIIIKVESRLKIVLSTIIEGMLYYFTLCAFCIIFLFQIFCKCIKNHNLSNYNDIANDMYF